MERGGLALTPSDDPREGPLESETRVAATTGEQPTAMLIRECQERRRKINRLHEQISTLSAENASQEKLSSSMSDQLHLLTDELHTSAGTLTVCTQIK